MEDTDNKQPRLTSGIKIGLILTVVWIVLQFVFLLASPLPKRVVDRSVWLIDTPISDLRAYGWGEFAFYAILLPCVVWAGWYIYRLSKKIAIVLAAVTILVVVLVFGAKGYKTYQAKVKAERDSLEAVKRVNEPKINRTFAGCTFGDTYAQVTSKVSTKYRANMIDSLSNSKRIVLGKVQYGNNFYDSMCFNFYKNRFSQFYLRKSYSDEENKIRGYKGFRDLFEGMDYPHDNTMTSYDGSYRAKYNRYNNALFYSDKYTELKLRHSTFAFDDDNQYVEITYYDKTSGEREEGL